MAQVLASRLRFRCGVLSLESVLFKALSGKVQFAGIGRTRLAGEPMSYNLASCRWFPCISMQSVTERIEQVVVGGKQQCPCDVGLGLAPTRQAGKKRRLPVSMQNARIGIGVKWQPGKRFGNERCWVRFIDSKRFLQTHPDRACLKRARANVGGLGHVCWEGRRPPTHGAFCTAANEG